MNLLLFLFTLPVAILTQGWVSPGEVRAIEQAFVDGENTGAAVANSNYGGYGGYGMYGGGSGGYSPYYGGYYGKK